MCLLQREERKGKGPAEREEIRNALGEIMNALGEIKTALGEIMNAFKELELMCK